MATHSSEWRIPWQRSHGVAKNRVRLDTFTLTGLNSHKNEQLDRTEPRYTDSSLVVSSRHRKTGEFRAAELDGKQTRTQWICSHPATPSCCYLLINVESQAFGVFSVISV